MAAMVCLILMSAVAQAQFWSEDFGAGMPADWLNEDLSGQGVLWAYCSEPLDCPPAQLPFPILEESAFESATATNGYVFVNSDGSAAHVSRLVTAPIDCSVAPERVVLKFETHIAVRLSPPNETAVVRVRNESSDWVTFSFFDNFGLLPELDRESCNPEVIYLDISNVAAGHSGVQIEWRWSAENDLSWALDDVALYDYHPLETNVVWGANPGEGDFRGGLNGWTVAPIFGDCDWFWEPVGWVGNSVFSPVPGDLKICSPTGNNGAAVISPDLCFSQNGQIVTPVLSTLTSPDIDLSDVTTGGGLTLEFHQLFGKGNAAVPGLPPTTVMYSVDGGQNWLDTLDCNPHVCFGPANFENSVFRAALPPEVLGTPQFRLRFLFAGDFFFWVVDDVRIMLKSDTDLKVNDRFFALPPHARVPASQMEPFPLLADVENVGALPADSVRLEAWITNASGAVVYADTLHLGTMAPGAIVENMPFENLAWFEPEPGIYRGFYRISSSAPDDFPADNVVSWKMEVTPSLFAREFGPCRGTGFLPSGNVHYELGNGYYVANADSLGAVSVQFGLVRPEALTDELIFVNFYQWKTDSTRGDANGDLFANESEIKLLGINDYKISGAADSLVTVPVDFDLPCIPLEDSTIYFATVTLPNSTPAKPLVISATEKLDYNATFFAGQELGLGGVKSYTLLRQGNESDFNALGFGLNRIPVVRLQVGACGTVATRVAQKPSLCLRLWPNPAGDVAFLSLEGAQVPGDYTLEIYDMRGKFVSSRQLESTIVHQLPLEVGQLPKGSYILRLISKNGFGKVKFSVLK